MKNTQYILLILVALIQFSCFEIIEDITIKNDGSGSLKYTINFSQSATKIKSLILLDEVEGFKVPTDKKIQYEFDNICGITKNVSGITNVGSNADMENYIFTYSCNFSKIENLNAIIDSVRSRKSDKVFNNESYFNYSLKEKTLIRKDDKVITEMYHKMSDSKKAIFNGADYTCIYKFENEIDSLSNKAAKLSISKKAVLLKLRLLNVFNNRNTLNNKIILK